MKSIMKEILYGNRGNLDLVKVSEEYWKLMGKSVTLHEELEKELTEKMKEKFGKFCELLDGLEAESSVCYYIEGMKIGILLGVEACN